MKSAEVKFVLSMGILMGFLSVVQCHYFSLASGAAVLGYPTAFAGGFVLGALLEITMSLASLRRPLLTAAALTLSTYMFVAVTMLKLRVVSVHL